MTLKIGSLFSGYGGLDLGVAAALGDAKTVWVSDIEPGPKQILSERFPDAPNLGDITEIDWAHVEPIDVLVGGSPCQDLSTAGQRAGMQPGTRSGLWESMAKAIKVLHPSLVVWENVKGALSADAFSLSNLEPNAGPVGDESGRPFLRALGRVLGDLTNLGYDARWVTVRAADVGAPHGRARVFLAAYPHNNRLRRLGGQTGRTATRHARPKGDGCLLPTPTGSDSNGHGQHGDGGLDLRTTVQLLPTPSASQNDSIRQSESPYFDLGREIGKLLPTPVSSFRDRSRAEVDERYGESNSRGVKGPNLDDIVHFNSAKFGDYTPAITRWEHILGREAPAPTTLNNNGKPHLSARFVEWMMGLPQGWVTDVDISRRLQIRALGNGVVPQQAAHALKLLLHHMQEVTA